MCGHDAHGQVTDNFFQYLNDVMLFSLFALSLGLSLHNKYYKLSYYLYVGLLILLIEALSFLGLPFYLFVLFLHKPYHKDRDEEERCD